MGTKSTNLIDLGDHCNFIILDCHMQGFLSSDIHLRYWEANVQ